MFDYIPIELQYDIINRLPVKSILAFRNVSKQWKSYIDSSDFIQQYGCRETANCSFTLTYEQGFQSFMCMVNEDFQFTPLNSNLQLSCLSPIGTSEGLWYFSYGSNMMTVLWNPSIRKSIGLFIPYFVSQLGVEKLSFGFGVRLDTLDPTLLKISYPYGGHGPWFVNVYTVSTSSWYPVKNHRLPRETVRIRKRSGQAVLRRFIYWLRDVLPSPFHISQLRSLIVLSGTFCVGDIVLLCGWDLAVDGASVTSFSMLFSIPTINSVKLIGFTNNDAPIVKVDELGYQLAHTLQVYDPISKRVSGRLYGR
ncbi:F-box domain containing protein [Tanacetum coccineum]